LFFHIIPGYPSLAIQVTDNHHSITNNTNAATQVLGFGELHSIASEITGEFPGNWQ